MKIKAGKDEFCMHCMEWREYDSKGRCKVCHKQIIKTGNSDTQGYSDLKKESSAYEYDQDTEEY